jgi:hypothetical protein
MSGSTLNFLLTVGVFLPAFAYAQSTVFSLPEQGSQNRVQLPSNAEIHGSLKMEASSYPSPIEDQPRLSQSLMTVLNFSFQNKTQSGFRNKIDTTVGKYLDWGGSFFGIQEAYSNYTMAGGDAQISVGRKIEFWSQVDSDWQLGLWEPKFNLDSLRPVNQGLTGIFYKQRIGDSELLLFGTPLFIPTMGPEIREQDGALVADSRWYQMPSRSSLIMNHDTDLVYSLNIPDLARLVSKPGAGFRFRYGGNSEGLWASVNFAHKPINNLLLKYDAKLVAATSSAEIAISPDVGYHNLWGWDIGYYLENGMISMSYLQDDPETVRVTNEGNTDWVLQQPGQLKMYAIHLDTTLPIFWRKEDIIVSIDYLRVSEILTYDVDSLGGDRGSLFPYRTLFSNAVSVKGTVPGHLFSYNLLTSLKYLRDLDQRGSLMGFEFQVKPSTRWLAYGGIDILSVDDSSEENLDARFLNQFRANDRFYGGFSYVF